MCLTSTLMLWGSMVRVEGTASGWIPALMRNLATCRVRLMLAVQASDTLPNSPSPVKNSGLSCVVPPETVQKSLSELMGAGGVW